MQPDFKVIYTKKDAGEGEEGKDITHNLSSRLVSLTITDNYGFESDSLKIVLDDVGKNLDIPQHGDKLEISLGYVSHGTPSYSTDTDYDPMTGLVKKGLYVIDGITLKGMPNVMEIDANAADATKDLKSMRCHTFQASMIGKLVQEIADRHNLIPVIDSDLKAEELPDGDLCQVNQSDIYFLTNLATKYDAVAKVDDGHLLFIKKGTGVTATTGTKMTEIKIRQDQMMEWSVSISSQNTYKKVTAFYYDLDSDDPIKSYPPKDEEKKGDSEDKEGEKKDEGVTTKEYQMREVFSSLEEAERRAEAKKLELNRGTYTAKVKLVGDPRLKPETPVNVEGVRDRFNSDEWIVQKSTHKLSTEGYTTDLELMMSAEAMTGIGTTKGVKKSDDKKDDE